MLEKIRIEGGTPLHGQIRVQGGKNAVLPIIAASVLNGTMTVLHNCPKITDVLDMTEILRELGCKAVWEKNTLLIDSGSLEHTKIPANYAAKMRASVLFIGSLLGRMKQAEAVYPGGCVIGERPIDYHVAALKQMGGRFEEEGDELRITADVLNGTRVVLPYPSVGATENTMMAAVLARGATIIQNAAKEPEIVELGIFLNEMGAEISGAGTDTIQIVGKDSLHEVEYQVESDRIVTGTYLLAAAGTRGQIFLEQEDLHQSGALCRVLQEMGGTLKYYANGVLFQAGNIQLPVSYIKAEPFPGFPTDLQSPLMAVLTTSDGESQIEETVFEARFKTAAQLKKMGARIAVEGKIAKINGVAALHGAEVQAEELRGGAALVIAGCMAKGVTLIRNPHFLKRGYEDICRDMAALGGKIQYME